MKSGARVLAVASGPINGRDKKRTILVGIVGRHNVIEGVLSETIQIDGKDGTNKILKMFNKSRFKEQIKCIAINGIVLAGLNVIDVNMLERKAGIPVIIMSRKKPDQRLFVETLRKFGNYGNNNLTKYIEDLNSNRPFARIEGFYVQSKLDKDELKLLIVTLFEFLRLAHMVARGVSTGISKGRM